MNAVKAFNCKIPVFGIALYPINYIECCVPDNKVFGGRQTGQVCMHVTLQSPASQTRQLPAQRPHVQICSRAKSALALRTAFEQSISLDKEANKALLAAMWAYINFERGQGSSTRGRIRVLLERAIFRFPVTVQLWAELIRHMEDSEMSGSVVTEEVEAVCRRATRNCPGTGKLWAARLRAIERKALKSSDCTAAGDAELWQQHSKTYHEALQACASAFVADDLHFWLKLQIVTLLDVSYTSEIPCSLGSRIAALWRLLHPGAVWLSHW
jgi:hypothetical protein